MKTSLIYMKMNRVKCNLDPVRTATEKFENGVFAETVQKCFQSTLHRRNFKTQQLPGILDVCLRKTRAAKSRDYRDVIVFEKLRSQNIFRPHYNARPAF